MLRFLSHWIMGIIHAVFPMFHRVPLKRVYGDEVYQTEREYLLAAHNAEHWVNQQELLAKRLTRLKSRMQELNDEAPVSKSES